MPDALELCSNVLIAISIFLAGRNSVHTWWIGILGCALFAWLFFETQLYADMTLQLFFIASSALGWWRWMRGPQLQAHQTLPVTRAAWPVMVMALVFGVLVTVGYGGLLWRYTDAYMPFVDAMVLAFSVVAQLLLMQRKLETWHFWLLVNTLSVPLFLSRGLTLTAVLYAAYWLNALVSLRHWRRLQAVAA